VSTGMRRVLDPHGWPPALVAALPPVLLALVLYRRTLLPGLALWDTAEFQAIGPVLGIAHPTGYPTYTLLAWLASVVLQPFGDEALRANLLSALLVSSAVGLVAATVSALTRHAAAGIVAGVALAVSEQPWEVALAADPHALHLFFVTLLLALLVGWMQRVGRDRRADIWLFAAAVTYGLALGNHALTILLAPGIGVFVFAVAPGLLRRLRFVAYCALAVVLTAINVYAYIPIRSAMDPPLDYANPQTWESFRYLVFGEQFSGTFDEPPPLAEALRTVARWTWQGLGALSALAGLGAILLVIRRWPLLVMLSAWFVLTWAFALVYQNAAIERYYLGPLAVVAVLGGLGVAGVIDLVPLLTRRLAQGAAAAQRRVPELARTYTWRVVARAATTGRRHWAPEGDFLRAAVAIVVATAVLLPILAGVPATLARVDRSADRHAERWVASVLPRLEQDAVIVSWWSYSTPLWYAQFVEGQRPDVFVVDDRTMLDRQLGDADDVIDRFLGQRPVYLIRLGRDLGYFEERYVLEPLPGQMPSGDGTVHRVLGRRDGA
jgi:hypothetical protein